MTIKARKLYFEVYEQGKRDERERLKKRYREIKQYHSLFINDFFKEFEKELMKDV